MAMRTASVLCLTLLVSLACAVQSGSQQAKDNTSFTLRGHSSTYNPRAVNWNSVASLCRSLSISQTHVAISFIHAVFEPSLVDTSFCSTLKTGCALDKSKPFPLEQVKSSITGSSIQATVNIAALQLASYHDASVADILAVCAAVSVESLSSNRVNVITGQSFTVGRLNIPAATALPEVIGKAAAVDFIDMLSKDDSLVQELAGAFIKMLDNFAKASSPVAIKVTAATAETQAPKHVITIGPASSSRKLMTASKRVTSRRRLLADIPPPNPAYPKPFPAIPPSPYLDGKSTEICSGKRDVRGFPSSAFRPTVFVNKFENPKQATRSFEKKSGEFVADVYEIDVIEKTLDLKTGCPAALPTSVLTYNGTVPGPTFIVPMGKQTIVRFNNKIPPNSVRYPPFHPCNGTRQGRPITIHLHGSASLAPYDGWAEDTTCGGETKDYVYPNNRPNSGWYHDHQLEITGENAHAGMAGFYFVKNSSDVGVGPDRWGMDGMTEYHFMIADRVMDSKCQFRYERNGVHKDNFYGDINLVSGIPFPVLEAKPIWTRFRVLNAAVTRPYLLKLVDNSGVDVSAKNCWVVAADGGYRRTPVPFPANGLFMGAAERYEVVCNMAAQEIAGKTLYLWNIRDEDRMKDVPFFCNTHLVMKINVAPIETCQECAAAPKFNPFIAPGQFDVIPSHLDHVFPPAEIEAAKQRAQAGQCDRTFVFGSSGGQWVINGQTWHSAKIAAPDVGLNSHEIWCLSTGGGWYHPIHIHLIDMFVLRRYASGSYQQLEPYEADVPKDVVQLHPGSEVAIMARWGPHRGEYMFHCHNLRHEDNEMMRALDTNVPQTTKANAHSEFFTRLNQVTFSPNGGALGLKVMYDNYADPEFLGASAKRTGSPELQPLDVFAERILDLNLYRIFYPGKSVIQDDPAREEERKQLCDITVNPWLVHKCS